MNATEVIAKALRVSAKDPIICREGYFADLAAQDALDALAAEGFAVVRLPEGNVFPHGDFEADFATEDEDGWVNYDGYRFDVSVAGPDARATLEGKFRSPEIARDLAAALLSAAAKAEEAGR